ncbi:MFS transporter [Phycicoccus sp. CSK15P-2]|uniref:MFS transporter n=1 Tax=Phycicoccus sp. CSK15P-2 TaxID=2807627 RepID=UPI001EF2DE42|nr:MFS transporter [Phycicoccus sp. CSK15P-2]
MAPSSPASAVADAPPSSRRWWTLAVVALAQLMVVLDATVVNIALPSAQADLGFSDADRQWVVTAYSLTFGSLLLLGGRLSDLLGRKRTFLVGLVGFALASTLGGAAPTFGVLIAARALQGVFGALLAPTALAVLTTTFTIPRERARAFGVFGALAGAGGAIGLLLGGVLTENLDWRWNLYINDVIAVVAFVGALALVPALERTGRRPRLDVPGTVLVSAGLFGLVFGFSNAERDGWGSPTSWGFLAAAALLLGAFAASQRRVGHPLLPTVILADRNRATAYASVMIAAIGMFGVFLFVTYYVQTTLGYSPIGTGLAFLPMIGMLVVAAQLGTNVLVPRFGPKVMVPVGMTLAMSGMLLLTRLGVDSSYAPDILVPLMVMGAGMGTIMPASMQTATLGVDREYAGVAGALVNTSQQVGGSIGTALLNTLAATAVTDYLTTHAPVTAGTAAEAAVHGYATAYWWGAGFFAAGAVLAAVAFRRHTRPAAEPETRATPAGGTQEAPAVAV